MQEFNFYVECVEIDRITSEVAQFGEIPFFTIADTYEEGRTEALEFAQSIARCYNDNKESIFYFRVCRS
jgi:hypothetical protein